MNIAFENHATQKKLPQPKPLRRNNKSGVKGVYWGNYINAWFAVMIIGNVKYPLGASVNVDECRKMRLKAEVDFMNGILPDGSPVGRTRYTYPWPQMKIGQSLFFSRMTPSRVTGSHYKTWKRLGMEIITRRTKTGTRVWRIK